MKSRKKRVEHPAIYKYHAIAVEYIKNNFCDLPSIYMRYYPKCSNYVNAEVCASQLLSNIKFQDILRDEIRRINPKDINIARRVLTKLNEKMEFSYKDADQITAAIALGRTEGMFKDNVRQDMHFKDETPNDFENWLNKSRSKNPRALYIKEGAQASTPKTSPNLAPAMPTKQEAIAPASVKDSHPSSIITPTPDAVKTIKSKTRKKSKMGGTTHPGMG